MSQGISVEHVRHSVEKALGSAKGAMAEVTTKRQLHAFRSRSFVAALGVQLRALHPEDSDLRVFTKHDESNRVDFGMNEMLYDVTVCRTATVASATGRKNLHHITAPIWHVESELREDSQQAIYDFNKLVLGAAPLNLFVGPLVSGPEAFIDVLRAPGSCCLGRVFVALIPHPRHWDLDPAEVVCVELERTGA